MLIQKVGDKFAINGEELSLQEVVKKYPSEFEAHVNKSFKSRDAMVEKTAYTEYSRAKRMHGQAEFARIVNGSAELLKQVAKFGKTKEDFIADAEAKVDAGKGQRG